MKKWLIVSLIGLVALLLSSYLYFRTTPQYSLLQLSNAAKSHDLTSAKQFIDIDGLADQVAEEVVNSIRQEINKPSTSTNEWEKLGEQMGKAIVEQYIPGISQSAKDQTKKALTDLIEGKKPSEGTYPILQELSWKDLLPGGRIRFSKDGAMRILSIPSQSGDKLSFRLRKENGNWKIVRWDNLTEISKKMADENLKKQEEQKKVNTRTTKFGEKTDLKDGWYLTVSAPDTYKPVNQFETPKDGNKFVAIEVTYDNSSTGDGTYDPSNFELKDSEDHRYKREYSGKEPQLNDGTLPPNQKAKGYITYQIPEKSEGIEVVYSSSAGGTIVFSK